MGDWREANTAIQAYNLNNPLFTIVEDAHNGSLNKELSFVNVNKENVMIEVIKKAEDSQDLIVRLYEYHNKRTNATLSFFKEIEKAYECDLMENNIEEINVSSKEFSFEIKPYEIKTFKIKLK